MKILMILPRFTKPSEVYDPVQQHPVYDYLMPVGMPYISAVLKKAGHDVTVINLNHYNGLIKDALWDTLQSKSYDLIFTGCLLLMYPDLKNIMKYIRSYSPSSKIVVGGGIISSQPDLMMNLLKPDYGVLFEGEETCLELANGKNPESIMGLAHWKDDKLIINPRRPEIVDLDSIPYPDMEGFGYDDFLEHHIPFQIYELSRPYTIVVSRNCTENCTFCFHTNGRKYRQRSIENIMGEIRYAIERYNINYICFLDELFAYDKPRFLELCKQISEYMKTVPYEMRTYCTFRVDLMDDEVADALKSINCYVVGFGLESYSTTILESMKKHITPEQIKNAINIVASHNIGLQGTFIFGDPAETLETAKETLKFYKDNQDVIRGGVSLDFIIPFPSTGVYRHCIDKGIIKDEMAFIENRAKTGISHVDPLNMTSLSGIDFEKLKDMVYTAEFLVSKYVPRKKISNESYLVKCPYCNVRQQVDSECKDALCLSCKGRFRIIVTSLLYHHILRVAFTIFGHRPLYSIKKKFVGDIHFL